MLKQFLSLLFIISKELSFRPIIFFILLKLRLKTGREKRGDRQFFNNLSSENSTMKTHDLLFKEREELCRSPKASPQLFALSNFITIGYFIVKAAKCKKESSGLQYNTDYPAKHILL